MNLTRSDQTKRSNYKNREVFSWPVRVYWEDTDAGGVVYHARYLNFFERARTEMIRATGVDQAELKEQHKLIWVVLEMNVKFIKAAKMDDELRVTAGFEWIKGVRQGIRQEITRERNGEAVASADVTAVMLHADTLKPARMPAWIKEKLDQQGF